LCVAHVVKEGPNSKTRELDIKRLRSSLVLELGSSFTTLCARQGAQLGDESSLWARQGEPLARGKGVYREIGSEGSPRQNAGLTNRNYIEACKLGKRAIDLKPNTCTGAAA
jgi:hypothetical protein